MKQEQKGKAPENLMQAGVIKSVGELMASIEDEILETKTGDLKEERARIVKGFRTLQMNGWKMYIEAMRRHPDLRKQGIKMLGSPELPTGA